MPFWKNVSDSPYRLNIGGSSFWAISNLPEDTYRGIAHFFCLSLIDRSSSSLASKNRLPTDHRRPPTISRKKKGFYASNPAAEIAVLEVLNQKNTPNTKGIRLGNYTIIREKIIDYLEQAFEGKISAKDALDQAVEEGNQLLSEFEMEHTSSTVNR